MKRTLIAIALACSSFAAYAADCGTPGSAQPPCVKPKPPRTPPVSPTAPEPTYTNFISNTPSAVSGANATAGAYGGYVGNVTAGNALTVEGSKAMYAPEVIAIPTAPCQIAVGGSVGFAGFSGGASTSVENEKCAIEHQSIRLQGLGLQAAAVQIMCLLDDSRLAIEATGIKCLIARPVKPTVTDRVTP
jgi:hypothetical protein